MRFTLLLFSLSWLFVASASAQSRVVLRLDNLRLNFFLSETGQPAYALFYKNRPVILPSALGLEFAEADFRHGFELLRVDSLSRDESWQPVWGEEKSIRNRYKEAIFHLKESRAPGRRLGIAFRIFPDGIGFRYLIPPQPGLNHLVLKEEHTQFALTGDHKAFWIPGDYDTNEYPYTTSKLSEVNAWAARDKHPEISTRVVPDPQGVATPLMLKSQDGLYINLHEAALVNYPAMQLHVDPHSFRLSSRLVPDAFGNKAYLQTPVRSPWRTVIVSDRAEDILASRTILNLNEPSVIQQTDWIKPIKYVGVWWEMHIGKGTWDYAGTQDMFSPEILSNLKPSGKHVATTARTKQYIDFAAKHGFDAVLVEGWNTGWEDWFGKWKEDVFDFVSPYPDFDVAEIQRYAASKGVKMLMHHETSGSVTNYERQLDTAMAFMKRYGYPGVKTGYVGKIIPRGEHHDGQWMVNHYNRVAAAMAANRLMLNAHEPVRPTGLHRTYPNWLACEAARGNEFNAWSGGNPPEHETILPFTRLMGGPMDYTPGIFAIDLAVHGKPGFRVHTTLCKQLALYVTMYSPLQMAADLPEVYEKRPDALQFIKDVAVDWDESRILQAEPGDYLAIARKAKGKESWFIGAISDENARDMELNLSFLDPGRSYQAVIYRDAPDAHWEKNPEAYVIEKQTVKASTILKLKLAAGGGAAISIAP